MSQSDPWTTTHEQLDDEEKITSGVTEDLIRISVGTEYIDDIKADFEQAFAAARSKLNGDGKPQNAEKGQGPDHEVAPVV